ncbi:MAG: 50S ribosomal protein L21 [Elusimicrobia bacterium RIFOXYB2_FULL_49_7]|nr:MAG: 50S ribosomal protein L21 [Elusimicrobia bacterium RIFOXYB2_FULL_49_7]
MYSIVDIAGFQYKVSPGDIVQVPTLSAEAEKEVQFDKVLLFSDGKETSIGRPYVSGASVKAKVSAHGKYDKVIIFKKRRRETYQKKTGHRQKYTALFITEIACGGKKEVFKPRPKKEKAQPTVADKAAVVK